MEYFQLNLEINQAGLEAELNKKLDDIGNRKIEIGFIDNPKMYERACKNEYGFQQKVELPDIGWRTIETPARPFMFTAFESFKEEYAKRLFKALQDHDTVDAAYDAVGVSIVNDIHVSIDGLLKKWEPNSEYTIFLKGRDQPLVDTGEMRDSVTYKVTK